MNQIRSSAGLTQVGSSVKALFIRQEAAAFGGALAVCLGLIVLGALQPLAGLFVHVSSDYGEGWAAYWSHAAANGGVLYPAGNPLVANNYPPVFFYAAGGLGRVIGDDIFAGRILATAGLAAVLTLIGLIVARLGAPRRWAIMSTVMALAMAETLFHPYIAVSNPQWPAQAIALASVLPLIAEDPAALRARSVVGAAGLLILGGLVKHNQFALPLAITLWLFAYNRRACAIWCLSGLILAGAAAIGLYALFGRNLFIELFGFSRTHDWTNFRHGLKTLAQLGGLIAVAAIAVRPLRGEPRATLFLLFAALGVLSGAGQRLGAGVYLNAHFDALIGLTIVCGTFLGRAAAGTLPQVYDRASRGRLLLLALAPVLLLSPASAVAAIQRTIALPRQAAIWTDMIAQVKAARGPVYCELLSVCYWAGRPIGIDFFAYGQRLRTGTDPLPLERLIGRRRAAVLIVDRSKAYLKGDGRLPRPFPALIERTYRVRLTARRSVALMVPR